MTLLIIVGFVSVIALQIYFYRRTRMALTDDLNAAVAALTAAQQAMSASITAELARVNATIAALQGAVGGGSVPDATVQAAIASLQSSATNLATSQQQLDAEDPATPAAS